MVNWWAGWMRHGRIGKINFQPGQVNFVGKKIVFGSVVRNGLEKQRGKISLDTLAAHCARLLKKKGCFLPVI